jgi:aspartyl-tRNA(Asn)/glutamyl-tRNA(Gln) amidotransferase subunit C
MSVDQTEIEKIAQLARVHVSEADIDDVTARIASILELVDRMQAADTSGVEPMAHPLNACQRLRDDEVTDGDRRSDFQALAPAVEDGLFLVPRVVE